MENLSPLKLAIQIFMVRYEGDIALQENQSTSVNLLTFKPLQTQILGHFRISQFSLTSFFQILSRNTGLTI